MYSDIPFRFPEDLLQLVFRQILLQLFDQLVTVKVLEEFDKAYNNADRHKAALPGKTD